jgi:hypothetical protein
MEEAMAASLEMEPVSSREPVVEHKQAFEVQLLH